MEIRIVGVLGCGLMGGGIAQVSAAAGYTTIVKEVNEGALASGWWATFFQSGSNHEARRGRARALNERRDSPNSNDVCSDVGQRANRGA